MQWLAVVLSSALVSALVSGVVTGLFNLSAARTQYKNEYYKSVVNNRISAYEKVEKLITILKTSVVDHDQGVYHTIFGGSDVLMLRRLLEEMQAVSLWTSREIFDIGAQLNMIMFDMPSNAAGLITFGKEQYLDLAAVREELEHTMAWDMLTLYDVPAFLQRQARRSARIVETNFPAQTPPVQPSP